LLFPSGSSLSHNQSNIDFADYSNRKVSFGKQPDYNQNRKEREAKKIELKVWF
jgi:hypothetical protein